MFPPGGSVNVYLVFLKCSNVNYICCRCISLRCQNLSCQLGRLLIILPVSNLQTYANPKGVYIIDGSNISLGQAQFEALK